MLNSKNDILPGLKTADVYYVRAGRWEGLL